jgi:hypothetical protein
MKQTIYEAAYRLMKSKVRAAVMAGREDDVGKGLLTIEQGLTGRLEDQWNQARQSQSRDDLMAVLRQATEKAMTEVADSLPEKSRDRIVRFLEGFHPEELLPRVSP